MSDSSSDAGDDWDDMAIVRAFEDALADKRAGGRGSSRVNGAKRGGKEKRSPSEPATGPATQGKPSGGAASNQTPSSSAYQYDSAAYPATRAYATAQAAAADQYQQQQQQQQQHQYQQQTTTTATDTYQEAYAQAYAAIMTQVQAATASSGGSPSYAQQNPMGMYGAPPPPSFQPQGAAFGSAYGIPTPPFAGVGGFTPAAQMHHAPTTGGDDGLANLLLAWYQSGYYTGRFQAMQEMKARPRR